MVVASSSPSRALVVCFGNSTRIGCLTSSTNCFLALGGPVVRQPRLLRTRLGANLRDLTEQELEDVDCRLVSGSILCGHRAADALAYLGRYHLQVSVLAEGRQRHFLGWLAPGSIAGPSQWTW